MNKLAIIIPAFKGLYFRDALKSIANQTNKNFSLYIADDNSSENLKTIVDEFRSKINIVYKKFENNLGTSNIVSHWKRSIDLTKNEEWFWLFSDDDLMPDDAVQRFFDFIDKNPKAEVVRFDSKIIGKNSEIKSERQPHPPWESSQSFLSRRFAGTAYSFIVDHIFKKDLYQHKGGLVDFPAAWASDDATWALFGKENGIFTIPGKPVLWRQSGINISSDQTRYAKKKIDASIEFLDFVKMQNFEIETKIQIQWLLKQFNMINPNMILKWYFYSKIFAAKNLSQEFKWSILRSIFR